MAALKKPIKKKDGGKPGTVLIIFLVFFILLSIGLGVFAYYGYDGQNKLREETASAKKAVTALKAVDDYRMGVIYMLASALGQDLDAADKERAVAAFDEILKDDKGKYAADATLKDRKAFFDLFQEIKDKSKDLPYDEAAKKFPESYRSRLKTALDDLKKTETQLGVTKKALKDTQDQYTIYQAKIDAAYKTALDTITKGNNAALVSSKDRFESFTALLKLNQEIQDQKLDLENKLKESQEQVAIEKQRFAKAMEEKKGPNVEVVPIRKNSEQHGLLLDMSRGIPFWDRPLGKITRVDLERRQVFINLGSSHGAKPELTFNIFADDGKGNADKFLKGTLEVIRVIDGQTSLARITSLYDSSGVEIALNDPIKGRAAREVEAGIRDGDLLFNMFWNTRIAIAGEINFTGFPIDAPAEQMRQIATFGQLLARMGIHVDSYLDLTDGQPKGSISNKTRFLVLGDRVFVKNNNDAAQVERAKLINDGIDAMTKDAIERGLFIISAENFTIAAGYRKPRNATNNDIAGFRPTAPLAGASTTGLVIQRDRPAGGAPPAPMPKEPEKKEPEAK